MLHKPFIIIFFVSCVLVACRNVAVNPTPVLVMSTASTATDVPSVANLTGHETFAINGVQAQEVTVFMNFIHAYNNGRYEEALSLLSENISGSDCDYRKIGVIVFQGKPQAAEWLRARLADHERFEVSRISNENPDSSGEHVIAVEYSRRSSATLEGLGFNGGIIPKLATKVIFATAPTLIQRFANGPYGADPSFCDPKD